VSEKLPGSLRLPRLVSAQVAYGPEMLYVHPLIMGTKGEIFKNFPEILIVEQINGEVMLIGMPRYEGFTQTVPELTRSTFYRDCRL
jgi:hypothetical protein